MRGWCRWGGGLFSLSHPPFPPEMRIYREQTINFASLKKLNINPYPPDLGVEHLCSNIFFFTVLFGAHSLISGGSGVDRTVVFQKGGFGGCSPRTKTRTRVYSELPPERKPERGYMHMLNEGTFAKTTLLRNFRCCFAPPSGGNRQGRFQSILVNLSRFFSHFQSILVNFSLTFGQFWSVSSLLSSSSSSMFVSFGQFLSVLTRSHKTNCRIFYWQQGGAQQHPRNRPLVSQWALNTSFEAKFPSKGNWVCPWK